MNWVLLAVVVAILVCMGAGYKKGLIKTVFSIGTFVASIILVIVLAPTTVKILQKNTSINDSIKKPVLEKLQSDTQNGISIDKFLKSYKVPEDIAGLINTGVSQGDSTLQENLDTAVSSAKEQAADFITDKVIRIIAYVLTFIIVSILLWIIGMALDLFARLPIIKGLNRVGGLCLGFVEGMVLVWILFLILSVFATTDFGQTCLKQIDESRILTFLYNGNLLMMFF